MTEEQKQALENILRQKQENGETIGIKDVTHILYPPNQPPEPGTLPQTP
ncbi:hypothetical protein ADIAL_0149 [Alkalibacterium sp. AK22]|nr:hypothetical protein [Alkalibacterium sp. AK22]EXJ24410.1 hypothetical protein ADIAL_0149 [Alkalibacterium sp. AK22]